MVDFTDDPMFDASMWQPIIVNWLNESAGWEAIGTAKVDFVSNCTSPNIRIEFHDLDDPEWVCGGAGACAAFGIGGTTPTDGHPHFSITAIKVNTPAWTCNNLPPGGGCFSAEIDKKRVINHEMGHMVGLGHDGPVLGITSGGGIYDEHYDTRPTTNEVYQARAHLNGRSSPSLHACIGFPASDRILVSWFDSANDETYNRASLWKFAAGILPQPLPSTVGYQHVIDITQGAMADVGSRVTFLTAPMSVGISSWQARADVIGGPRNMPNWDPVLWTPNEVPSSTVPNKPCTFALAATGNGQVSLTWKDGSYNEDKWHLYYSISTGGHGALGTWNYRGACNGANIEGCRDTTSFTTLFNVGDRLCARVTAGNVVGQSGYSNIACTTVQ